MKRVIVFAMQLIFVLAAIGVRADQNTDQPKFLPDKIVVVMGDNSDPISIGYSENGYAISGIDAIDGACREYGISEIKPFYGGNLRKPCLAETLEKFYVFTLSDGADLLAAISVLNSVSDIKYAEPVSIAIPSYEPNDPFLGLQWYFGHTHTFEAWDIVRGDTTRHSIIAIIDTGVDWEHEDIAPNVWVNQVEDINHNGIFDTGDNNGIDDDDNGFIDDVVGWDFGANDNDPSEDALIHGTAVASVASEATDNGILGAGMGYSSRLMCTKGADQSGYIDMSALLAGVIYAADNGAQIINCSFYWSIYHQSEQDIIDAVWAEDALVIAAAGGNGEGVPNYPSAYNHVMAVTALDRFDHKASFGPYGSWIDIAAPGIEIQAIYGDQYITYNGTSFSTALVSGLAGLARTAFPNYTNDQIQQQIEESADNIDDLNPGFEGMLGAGRINAYNCVAQTYIEEDYTVLPSSLNLKVSPNPFNPSTTISYSLSESGEIKLEIFNVLGQRIEFLYSGRQSAGTHNITWDASAFPSGVYFARLEAGGNSENMKMVLLK